jgi:hypothetical protein
MKGVNYNLGFQYYSILEVPRFVSAYADIEG